MYWPEDNTGDHFNSFKNILGQVKDITGDVTSIVTDLGKLAALVVWLWKQNIIVKFLVKRINFFFVKKIDFQKILLNKIFLKCKEIF